MKYISSEIVGEFSIVITLFRHLKNIYMHIPAIDRSLTLTLSTPKQLI